jgi:hypothetical protein
MYRVRYDRLRRQVERSIVRAERSDLHAFAVPWRSIMAQNSQPKTPPW